MLEINRIYRMDAFEGLARIDDESVDLVVTDPPYNIASKEKRTLQGAKVVSTGEAWGHFDQKHPFDHEVMLLRLLGECWRVLKPGGSLYVFTAIEDIGHYIRKAKERGFVYRHQLALLKKNPLPSLTMKNWRGAFELCFYATKDKAKTFNFPAIQSEAVNLFWRVGGKKLSKHPTEKPLEMIKRLVAASSNPGDLVLDPFMGSGTTAVACAELSRHFIGFERDEGYASMARERLRSMSDRVAV